jgi:hypothetical protein
MFPLNKLTNLCPVFVCAFALTQYSFSQDLSEQSRKSSLQFVQRPDEEILILQFQLDRYILSDGITGYLTKNGTLLSLQEVASALEFGISVDPATGQASGWTTDESRIFALDLYRRDVVVNGKRESVDLSRVELHEDGIYVDALLLSKWIPADLIVNLSRLTVKVSPREKLPIQTRLERETAQSKLNRSDKFRPSYPRARSSYALLDWPFVDASSSLYQRSAQLGGREARYSGYVSGDFLFLSTTLYLAGMNGDSLTDARLTMGRHNPEGKLLGPLNAQSIELGDLFTPQLSLACNSQPGRGLEINSFPLSRPSEYDRTTLRGELPPNWEVELYRNDVLLDVQSASSDGQYEFVDVPLLYGSNVFRLVFYGPQGQKREEVKSAFVGSGMIRSGEGHYRISATQQDKYIIRDRSFYTNSELIGDGRFIAEYELGISHNVSVSTGGASIPFEGGRKNFANLGLRASLLGTFSRLDISRNLGGGTALLLAAQTDLFGKDVYAEHVQFVDYESERFKRSGDPIKNSERLRINGSIPFWPVKRISFGLDGYIEQRQSGQNRYELNNRISIHSHGFSVSNNLRGSLIQGGGIDRIRRVDGQFLLSGQFRKLTLRSQISYDPPPNQKFKLLSLSADYRFSAEFNSKLIINRDLILQKWTDYTVGFNRTFEEFIIGLEGRYENEDNYSLRLTLSFSLGWQRQSHHPVLSSHRMGNSGAASVRVYLDKNFNGQFDENDQPLEGVRLRYSGRTSSPTDTRGVTFMTGLSCHRTTGITLELGTLEDPFWFPVNEGLEIIPRPGKTIQLDFPVVETGEIDGTVFLQRGTSTIEASNVVVQLLDYSRKILQEVKTSFDGFYLFTNVPPGLYIVRISEEQMKRLKLKQIADNRVRINKSGQIISNQDFTIVPLN